METTTTLPDGTAVVHRREVVEIEKGIFEEKLGKHFCGIGIGGLWKIILQVNRDFYGNWNIVRRKILENTEYFEKYFRNFLFLIY